MKRKNENYYVLLNAVCYLCASRVLLLQLCACDNIFLVRCRRRRRGNHSLSRVFFFCISQFHVLISIVRMWLEVCVEHCVRPACIWRESSESMMRCGRLHFVCNQLIKYTFFPNHSVTWNPTDYCYRKNIIFIFVWIVIFWIGLTVARTHFAVVYFPAKKFVSTNTQYASS